MGRYDHSVGRGTCHELGSEAVLNDCENRREKLLFTLDPTLFTHSSAEGVGLFMTTINISYRLTCGHSLSFLLYLRGELPGHKVTVHLNSWTRASQTLAGQPHYFTLLMAKGNFSTFFPNLPFLL